MIGIYRICSNNKAYLVTKIPFFIVNCVRELRKRKIEKTIEFAERMKRI